MVIWQQSPYPISSTVVAKGLCQLSETGNETTVAPTCLQGVCLILQGPSGINSGSAWMSQQQHGRNLVQLLLMKCAM